jgi:hypothetical protein
MKQFLKILAVTAFAAGMCSCGAGAGSYSALDGTGQQAVTEPVAQPTQTPDAAPVQTAPARGTSSWIGDECGLKPLLRGLLGGVLGSNSGSGNNNSGNDNSQ